MLKEELRGNKSSVERPEKILEATIRVRIQNESLGLNKKITKLKRRCAGHIVKLILKEYGPNCLEIRV